MPPPRPGSGAQGRPETESDVPDAFESRISEEAADPPRVSVDLDDLPIELISLTDRFIDSLSAKVHPHPPNIDNLSRLFQEFYATASSHIQTHVDALATRQKREEPQARASAASLFRAKAVSLASKDKSKDAPPGHGTEQPLLTGEELADRKRARRALEQKKGLFEEAVERRLCEGIYSKIYRHRSTQDEAQDAKLRSKTAALAVVGIGPADLGVDLGTPGDDAEASAKKLAEVREWLEDARKELVLMSQSRYPLGKLNHLKAAHKSIIDTLSHFHPSSSADELIPMLIYTLITLPPESVNVISDVKFIQRFRWEPKLVGEAAYCLTTLEATISFLETVDLSTLRADETPTGPRKGSGAPPAPKSDTFPPAFSPTSPSPATLSPNPSETAAGSLGAALKQSPTPAGFRATVGAQLRGPRRLSELVNTPAQAFNAASDAVLNTADHGLKTIGTSLGDSYKSLLGRLRERALEALQTKDGGEVVVPKTLDDARKLIGTPPPPPPSLPNPQPRPGPHEDDVASAASSLSLAGPNPEEPERPPLLSFISGAARKVSRDHSADSARSAGSKRGEDKKQQQQQQDTATTTTTITTTATTASSSSSPATTTTTTTATAPAGSSPIITSPPIMDSMRSLGSSLNPMARLSAGIGGFRGFGRSSSAATTTPVTTTTTPPARAPTPPAKDGTGPGAGKGDVPATDGGDLATVCFFPQFITYYLCAAQ